MSDLEDADMNSGVSSTWDSLRFLAELMRTSDRDAVDAIVTDEFLELLADEVERLTPPFMHLSVVLPFDTVHDLINNRTSEKTREILIRACEKSWSGGQP